MPLPVPRTYRVPRGEALTIPIPGDLTDLGSPPADVRFTLATERNSTTKVYSADATLTGSPPAYVVELDGDVTNRAPGVYWWDVWRMDTPALLALGSLEIQAVVRLP